MGDSRVPMVSCQAAGGDVSSRISPRDRPFTFMASRSSLDSRTFHSTGRPPALWKSSMYPVPTGLQFTSTGVFRAASWRSSSVRVTPARRAMAMRWITALVDPPSAASTTDALRNDARVRYSRGSAPQWVSSTMRLPVITACRSRSPDPESGVAPPGSIRPSVAVRQAMVEAVPMTMHVPPVGHRDCSISPISSRSISPARCRSQYRRQSVQAPRRSPCQLPVRMAPVTSEIAGSPAETAAINWAGTVLSQPPSSTTPSIGCDRIISSVPMAIRLRKSMEVGESSVSASEMVGKTRARPPAWAIPRRTPSTKVGMSR